MHFGADSGSKLVGKWQNDKKDGPGILCCGNGEVIACDPLFENDKPVHKKNVPKIMKNLETSGKLPVFSKLTGNNLFRTVANLIGKKVTITCSSSTFLQGSFFILLGTSLSIY